MATEYAEKPLLPDQEEIEQDEKTSLHEESRNKLRSKSYTFFTFDSAMEQAGGLGKSIRDVLNNIRFIPDNIGVHVLCGVRFERIHLLRSDLPRALA